MKTKMFIFAIAMGAIFASCNKNEVKEDNFRIETSDRFENLYSQINTLNASYVSEYPIEGKQKCKFWKRIKLIALCDLTGAIVGGSVAGGAGAIGGAILLSLGGAIGPLPNVEYTTAYNSNEVGQYTLETYDVGSIHNTLILEILEENPDLYEQNFDFTHLTNLVEAKMLQHGLDFSREQIGDVLNQTTSMRIIEDVLTANDENQAINRLVSRYPNLKSEFQVVNLYLEQIKTISNEEVAINYTNDVIKIIEESAVPVEAKKQINSGIAVFANSTLLWNDN
ncbi:MAG: hypothetical protein QM751_04270 [Paludibacteraceae bacterium]